MSYLTDAAEHITNRLQEVMQEVADSLAGRATCPHCTNGKTNMFGEVRFEEFMCGVNIMKTNDMYFLEVNNRVPKRINACPMCGRQFKNSNQE